MIDRADISTKNGIDSVSGAAIGHKVAPTPVALIAQRLPPPIPRAAAPTVGAGRGGALVA